MEDSLIFNWGIKIVPSSSWTMEKKVTKWVEIAPADDKRHITGVLGSSLVGPNPSDLSGYNNKVST